MSTQPKPVPPATYQHGAIFSSFARRYNRECETCRSYFTSPARNSRWCDKCRAVGYAESQRKSKARYQRRRAWELIDKVAPEGSKGT